MFRLFTPPVSKIPRTGEPGSAALFITTPDTDRIRGHFGRFQSQTAGLLDAHYVVNATNAPDPIAPYSVPSARDTMPLRWRRMVENGGLYGGFTDLLFVPLALGARAEHVWIVEYDVDFSGDWGDFFRQFENNDSDALVTSVTRQRRSRDWFHWPNPRQPTPVRLAKCLRAFFPIMRLSRRFLSAYVDETARDDWPGHCEYIVPTLAALNGFTIQDIGGDGEFCPRERRHSNYLNTPEDHDLSPGTLVFRPSRGHYFHEDPGAFANTNMLHHPVKPN